MISHLSGFDTHMQQFETQPSASTTSITAVVAAAAAAASSPPLQHCLAALPHTEDGRR
jgi:hypothetical protein